MNYTIYIEAEKTSYNLRRLLESDVRLIVSKIEAGTKNIFVNGKLYQLENIKEIRIFECDSVEKYNKAIKNPEYNKEVHIASDLTVIFKPSTLAKFNRDVTKDFFSVVTEFKAVANSKVKDQFINASRINELKNVTSKKFDLSRLIKLCEEINMCYETECYIATIILTRSLLDHIPPIFEKKSFLEVVNNYGSKSFKETMLHLENSSRKIADLQLHTQIRKHESTPNETQVNFSQGVDLLLSEISLILKNELSIPELNENPKIDKSKESLKKDIGEQTKLTTQNDLLNEINQQRDLVMKREQFLKSKLRIEDAEKAVDEILKIIANEVKYLKANGISFPNEGFDASSKNYILQSEQHSISINWNENIEYSERTGIPIKNDSKLFVNLHEGHIFKANNLLNYKKVIRTTIHEYAFDINVYTDEIGWKWQVDNKFYSNNDIVKMCTEWILNQIKESLSFRI